MKKKSLVGVRLFGAEIGLRAFRQVPEIFGREAVAAVVVDEDGLRRERPSRHVLHLDGVTATSSAKVGHGLDLPDKDAHGQEEEEAREEDGEENEEVDVELILSEVDGSERCSGFCFRFGRPFF